MNHLQETAFSHVKGARLLRDDFGSTPEMLETAFNHVKALSSTPFYFSLPFSLHVEEILTSMYLLMCSTKWVLVFISVLLFPLDQIAFTFSMVTRWRCCLNRGLCFNLDRWKGGLDFSVSSFQELNNNYSSGNLITSVPIFYRSFMLC